MTASQKAKAAGFKSLAELVEWCPYERAHLHRINRDDPERFYLIIIDSWLKRFEALREQWRACDAISGSY